MNKFEQISSGNSEDKEKELKLQKTKERIGEVIEGIEGRLNRKIIKEVCNINLSEENIEKFLKNKEVKDLCEKIKKIESQTTPVLKIGKEGIGYTEKEELAMLKEELRFLIKEILNNKEKAA